MAQRLLALAGVLLACGLARADMESGPKVGDKVAELKAQGVIGTGEGKEVDYAADRKDAPTVYLFVNAEKFDRPMNRFMKALDGKLADVDKAAAVAVWVGGDADKTKEYLPKVQGSVKYENTALGVFAGDANGPKGWGINSSAHLTVVVASGGTVAKTFAFESVNETDVKAVMEALAKAAKPEKK